jgi:hypothetical protein
MNAGTCWGKNTIGSRGRSVEKAPGSDFTFTLLLAITCWSWLILHHVTLHDHCSVMFIHFAYTGFQLINRITGFLFKHTSVSVTATIATTVALLTNFFSSNLLISLVKKWIKTFGLREQNHHQEQNMWSRFRDGHLAAEDERRLKQVIKFLFHSKESVFTLRFC